MLTSIAFHDPKGLDGRRKELRAKLRNDPSAPEAQQPKWTHEEMVNAANHLIASIRTSGKLVS